MRHRRSVLLCVVFASAVVACRTVSVNEAGIRNFSRLDDSEGVAGATVGFGGATPSSAMVWLRDQGFASVVNLRLADEEGVDVPACRDAARLAGVRYIHLPFDSDHPDPLLVPKLVADVGREANQPVYIHCNSGNRVGALWMILRVLEDGWTLEDARREAKEIGLTEKEAEAFATKYVQEHR